MNLSVTKIGNNMADALERVVRGGERVVLKRGRKRLAALVSVRDLELLKELEDRADVEAARAALAEGGTPIPLDKVLADLGIKTNRPPARRKRVL